MKDVLTIQEIKDKIASNDYNAELLLQHLVIRVDELAQLLDSVELQLMLYKDLYE